MNGSEPGPLDLVRRLAKMQREYQRVMVEAAIRAVLAACSDREATVPAGPAAIEAGDSEAGDGDQEAGASRRG